MKLISTILILLFLPSCAQDWSYQGNTAPQYWGSLKEEYKFCKIGYNQSPINIDFNAKNEQYIVKNDDLKFSYSSSGVTKEQDSHGAKFSFDRKDFMTLRKREYYLQAIQFHRPSEHKINGEDQILEMQIFHKSDNEQVAVLAVFVKLGKESPEFDKLIALLENNKKDVWSDFNVGKVLNKNDKIFFYDGSLTTPPCTEGIKWLVMKTPVEMSQIQVDKIIGLALKGIVNVRPLQEFHPDLY
jgi:carbonic anhydrase